MTPAGRLLLREGDDAATTDPWTARVAKYGVGARLDEQPELLFVLRGVDHEELIDVDAGAAGAGEGPAAADSNVPYRPVQEEPRSTHPRSRVREAAAGPDLQPRFRQRPGGGQRFPGRPRPVPQDAPVLSQAVQQAPRQWDSPVGLQEAICRDPRDHSQ
ncbi:MAG: hypothetical protein OXG13_11770 [Gemmatimonadaceae bacterium]|nr:hypothetical protein [Gemmatimonadaceae bacterium]